nr:glycosyltransferase [Acetobacter estunensis]
MTRLRKEIARLRVASRQDEVEVLRQWITAYETSTSWRLTAPLRHCVKQIARLKRRKKRPENRTAPGAAQSAKEDAPPATLVAVCPVPEPPVALRFPRHARPVLSIVIPTYGQVPVTLRCLRSICRHPPTCPYEVIVAEDASGDPSVAQLADIAGLVLIRRTENLGFLKNCNDAARKSAGTFVHFLNNDTEVHPDAFDALVERLQRDPSIGLTGSKLLFPDGRLQEAGGIIWNDASGWNFGRNDMDPDRSAYDWPREVDYISGASIMLPRAVFDALGGFDEIFAPAYYEDTDLAFRVRTAGLRVVYEPRSVVVHHEGVSHGTDETSGVKAFQVRNRERMLTRWKEVLEAKHYAPATHFLRASVHAHDRRTILIIDHYVPEPDRDAGSRATLCVIDALLTAGWLVVFWPENRVRNAYTYALLARGVNVIDCSEPDDFPKWIARNGPDLDHVLLMRPTITRDFLPDVKAHTQARLSYYGHDIHFLRLQREAEVTGSMEVEQAAAAMEELETSLWRQVESVIYLSEPEAALVRERVPQAHPYAIVPFCYRPDLMERQPPRGHTVLFVGGFAHPPNVDAAIWLVRDIMPRLRARLPDAHLILAGANPTEEVRALADTHTRVTGAVSEEALHELYATSRAAAVPLRFGAGVKNKVLEALHQGLPLVTTVIGAEGITDLSDVATVTDDTGAFATALFALLTEDGMWTKRSRDGRAFIAARYSPAAFSRSLLTALGENDRHSADVAPLGGVQREPASQRQNGGQVGRDFPVGLG